MKPVIFQQDGPPPHCSDKTLKCLNYFLGQLISRQADFLCLPYSPDLNLPHFFLWCYLKEQIYANNPKTLHLLEASACRKITPIPADMIESVFMDVATRIAAVIQQGR